MTDNVTTLKQSLNAHPVSNQKSRRKNLLTALWKRFEAHHRRKQAYGNLLDQPDYVLEDIGLTRLQVKISMYENPNAFRQ